MSTHRTRLVYVEVLILRPSLSTWEVSVMLGESVGKGAHKEAARGVAQWRDAACSALDRPASASSWLRHVVDSCARNVAPLAARLARQTAVQLLVAESARACTYYSS